MWLYDPLSILKCGYAILIYVLLIGKVKNHLPIIPNVKRCFRLVNTSFELPYIELTTYMENFYPEKLKNEGSPRWASKKQKG